MVAEAFYDTGEAVIHIHRIANLPRLDIERVLAAQVNFLGLLGVYPGDPANAVIDMAAERKAHADLLCERDLVTYDCEAEYVRRKTTLPPRTVTAIIAAETSYKIRLGLMDPEALPAYQEWAARWTRSCEKGAEEEVPER